MGVVVRVRLLFRFTILAHVVGDCTFRRGLAAPISYNSPRPFLTEFLAMKRLFLFALLAALVGGLTPTARLARADEPKAGKDFFFKPGDRIVFLGDSITML